MLACVSAADHLGLALLEPPSRMHLWAAPRAHVRPSAVRLHRSIPILPPTGLVESLPDLLGHVALCLPHAEALIVWESAIRRGLVATAELRRVRWRHPAARSIAGEAGEHADSLLESLVADLLRHARIAFRQQAPVLGHPVDVLVGDRIVVQLDGYAFHSDARERARDAEHDARLQMEGFRVLRFTYRDVVARPEHLLDVAATAGVKMLVVIE